jgi:hypothetical protein
MGQPVVMKLTLSSQALIEDGKKHKASLCRNRITLWRIWKTTEKREHIVVLRFLLLSARIAKPTSGIIVNAGTFVNIVSPKNMPYSYIASQTLQIVLNINERGAE